MSTTLRFSTTGFFGIPSFAAVFGKAAQPVKARTPAARGTAQAAPRQDGLPNPAGTYPSTSREPGLVDMNRLLQAVKTAPELSLIEWDGDRARAPAAPSGEPGAEARAAEDPHAFEPRRRKIRDRYISARFPGVARGSADLAAVPAVIKSARLMFEEEQAELALELLQLALEEAPQESQLWLARLEILFLERDREGFVAAARAFRDAHPSSEAWPEVERLGRAIAPGEALFGATSGPREHEHYGPWPHLPNWIQAPWDLTAEIVAADFHRAVRRLGVRLASNPQAGD